MCRQRRAHAFMIVALAGVLVTAWPALAQRGGRGGAGGFRGAPAVRGGFGRPGFGFSGRGFSTRDEIGRPEFNRRFWPYGWGYGYGGYGYGGWGSGAWGGDMGWWPYAAYGSIYPYWGAYGPDNGYGYPPGGPPPNYQALYPPSTTADGTVLLDVRVPDNADVWVDGHKTKATGTDRQFTSPTLRGGRTYLYDVRARWKDGDSTVDQTRTVRVQPGDRVKVDLMAAGRR